MTIKYIETRLRLAWRKNPNIPLIALSLSDSEGYGHVKKWIEENIKNKIYILIDNDGEAKNGILTGSWPLREILIVFSEKEDYTAFKLMFPEYC